LFSIFAATILAFTLPDTGPVAYRVFDPEIGDSIDRVDYCDSSPEHLAPIRQLQKVVLWKYQNGVGFAPVDSHTVIGREGQADSFIVSAPGHYTVQAWNPAGPSCFSNIVTVQPPILTGVEEPADAEKALSTLEIIDVQGRHAEWLPVSFWPIRGGLVRGGISGLRLSSGVYWLRAKTTTGAILVKKVVLLR